MRKKKWIKRLAAAVLILLALLVLASNIVVDLALVPEKMEQTQAFEDITEDSYEALVKTDDIEQNKMASLEKTEKWVRSADSEEVSVTTKDGYRLLGRAFYQEGESHDWVLLLHGYTGWKEEMYPIAFEYAERGYQVLVPDMRCSGESEGDFIGMGWTDRKDNLLWLQTILKKDKNARIVIHGQSMGGACALMMTGEDLPDNVKAVVSDSAYTDAYSIFKKQLKDWFHLPGFPLVDGADLMLQIRGGYSLKKASALDAVKKSTIPLLIIHGEEDVFVPVEMAYTLYDAADCEKELLIVEGAAGVLQNSIFFSGDAWNDGFWMKIQSVGKERRRILRYAA